MTNEQWLMEWVDASHIRTFERKSSGTYEMLHPQLSDVFDVQAAKKADYERYWKAWIKYSGYTEQKEIDLCLVCPEGISIDAFLTAAQTLDIHIASPTEWAVSDVVECLEQNERYASAEVSDVSPVKITLDNGLCLLAHSGDGRDFRPSDIRETISPSSNLNDDIQAEGNENKTVCPAIDNESSQASSDTAQATQEEIREAIRRISGAQCRTIDNKR